MRTYHYGREDDNQQRIKKRELYRGKERKNILFSKVDSVLLLLMMILVTANAANAHDDENERIPVFGLTEWNTNTNTHRVCV